MLPFHELVLHDPDLEKEWKAISLGYKKYAFLQVAGSVSLAEMYTST